MQITQETKQLLMNRGRNWAQSQLKYAVTQSQSNEQAAHQVQVLAFGCVHFIATVMMNNSELANVPPNDTLARFLEDINSEFDLLVDSPASVQEVLISAPHTHNVRSITDAKKDKR